MVVLYGRLLELVDRISIGRGRVVCKESVVVQSGLLEMSMRTGDCLDFLLAELISRGTKVRQKECNGQRVCNVCTYLVV